MLAAVSHADGLGDLHTPSRTIFSAAVSFLAAGFFGSVGAGVVLPVVGFGGGCFLLWG